MIDSGTPSWATTLRTAVPAAVDGAVERRGDVGDPFDVDERGNGSATGGECPFDDEVAFGEEHPGPGVVALVGPARQPTFVEAELPEARIVRILDPDHVHQRPTITFVCGSGDPSHRECNANGAMGLSVGWRHQKWYG